MRRILAFFALTSLLGIGSACGVLTEEERWWDQLQADSPCYRVDLLDGLDESSLSELDALFACINHHGHIEPLLPVAQDALHSPARSGDPAGIELARTINAMLRVDVDPFALAGLMGRALQAEDRPFNAFVDVFLELGWGARANRVRTGSVPLTSSNALEQGVLVPLAPVIPEVAGALLDDSTNTAGWVGSWLPSYETKRWIRTGASWLRSDHPVVQRPVDDLVPHLGQLLQATRDGSNDRWSQASGDSLRDLLDVYYLRDDPVLGVIAEDAHTLLSDAGLRRAIEPALVHLHDDGHLQRLPPQVVWMTTVDAQGGPRGPGEASSLEAFLRLLTRANGPVNCLGLYRSDNLALEILSLLADLDPATVSTGLEIVAWITGNTVTDWALEQAVRAGACDGIDQALLDDLDAIQVIIRPEARDVLVAFIRVLAVLKHDADQNQLPVLANLVQDLYEVGGYPPLEELLRDVGEEPLLVDLVDLVPVLAAPGAYGITAGNAPAVDLEAALDVLEWVFAPDDATHLMGWERVKPLLKPALEAEGTWTALEHASALMVDERTQTSQFLTLLPPLMDLDPELSILAHIGALLEDQALQGPFLRLVETPAVSAALLASEPAPGQDEVPLAFLGRLMVGGALDDLLLLVDLLFATTR